MTDDERAALVDRRTELLAKMKGSTKTTGGRVRIMPGATDRVRDIQAALDDIEAKLNDDAP